MRISSKDLARAFGKYADMALQAPVVITKNGRDRLVLLSVEEYNFLRDSVESQGADAPAVSLPRATKRRAGAA